MSNLLSIFESFRPHLVDHLIYVFIALVTLIGLVKCLIPLWTTTAAMHRAIRKLQDEAGTTKERPVWQEPRFMGKRLRGCWLRFLQNAEQIDRRGLPCNVEDYVNDDTVTHGPGNAQLAELIPSLLTSLGILGTFMGMTEGLSGLDVTTTDQMMSGIQNLLNGMQFAFGTSVAGVACSLAFNMLNRIAQGSSYRAIDDFTEAFTSLAMQRPLDNDVQLIIQNQDRNHMLMNVSDAVTTTIPTAVEKAVGNALLPVAHSMDQFLVGATQSQIDGVARIVDRFVDQMNISLNGQFLLLGKTMTEMNQNQRASLDNFQQSFGAVHEIMTDVTHLHDISDALLKQFEHYIQELSLARNRDEGFEKNSTELLGKMHRMSNEQLQVLDTVRKMQDQLMTDAHRFEQSTKKAVESMQSSELHHTQALADTEEQMQAATKALADRYASFSKDIIEGLSKAIGMFEQNMQEVFSEMTEQLQLLNTKAGAGDVLLTANSLQQTLAEMESAVKSIEKTVSITFKEKVDTDGTTANP